ncbi:hypothetical protein QTP88_008532 [Uroleucon formosanum]
MIPVATCSLRRETLMFDYCFSRDEQHRVVFLVFLLFVINFGRDTKNIGERKENIFNSFHFVAKVNYC